MKTWINGSDTSVNNGGGLLDIEEVLKTTGSNRVLLVVVIEMR